MRELQRTAAGMMHSDRGSSPCFFCGDLTYHFAARVGAIGDECTSILAKTEVYICGPCAIDIEIDLDGVHFGKHGGPSRYVPAGEEAPDQRTPRRAHKAAYDEWVMSTHPTNRKRTPRRGPDERVTQEFLHVLGAIVTGLCLDEVRAGNVQAHTYDRPLEAEGASHWWFSAVVPVERLVGAVAEARTMARMTLPVGELLAVYVASGYSHFEQKIRRGAEVAGLSSDTVRDWVRDHLRENF